MTRALVAVFMKYISCGGMAYNVYSKLVESVVEPVLFYCSGIWGHNRYGEIDAVLNRACRMYLGLIKMPRIPRVEGICVGFLAKLNKKLGIVRL